MRQPLSLGRALRLLAAVAVVAVAAVGWRLNNDNGLEISSAAPSTHWPGGVVRFYNSATDQQWAVDRAVAAWNSSGASVRFVPVAARDAELVIRDYGTGCHHGAEATVGKVARATVRLPHLYPADGSCNRYSAAVFAAHELGHVLGLTHQLSGCAAMNRAGSYRGPELCKPSPSGFWWCGLLERDDVARAVGLYGGAVLPRRSQDCRLYRAPAAPPGLTARAVRGGLEFRFRRPAAPAIPGFVAVDPRSADAFVPLLHRGRCAVTGGNLYRWSVPVGGTMKIAYRASPDSYCFVVRARDRTGQRGPAARYRIVVR